MTKEVLCHERRKSMPGSSNFFVSFKTISDIILDNIEESLISASKVCKGCKHLLQCEGGNSGIKKYCLNVIKRAIK